MSALSINLAEKRLLQHLRMGGDAVDPVGKELIVKFAATALKDPSIGSIAQRYGISMQDICFIYSSMITALMPNPCIESGGPLLVPTLFFMEPFRFEGLASEISAQTQGLSNEARLETMTDLAVQCGQQTWMAHSVARGEFPFKIQNSGGLKSASGCLGIIALTFALAGAFGLFLTVF